MKGEPLVLITGGARRIGRALALAAAREGFDVAVHYNHSRKEAETLAGEIEALGRKAALLRADLSRPAEIEDLAAELAGLSGLYALVNNASIYEKVSWRETDRENWDRLFGIVHPLERWNFGGIGIAGVHWFRKNPPDLLTRKKTMPFGRAVESGYYEGLKKYAEIKAPTRLIWFGDGAGDDTLAKWGSDNGWWIRSPASDYSQGDPGFNRVLQNDYGCRRHSNKANYVFADGHVELLDANRIPCNEDQCWWSILPYVHRPRTVAVWKEPL